jgi:PAS domain S-box-containing protein
MSLIVTDEDPNERPTAPSEQSHGGQGRGLVGSDPTAAPPSTRDPNGRLVATPSSGEDVTTRRQAGTELAHAHALLTRSLDAIPDAVFLLDGQGRFTYANATLLRWLGREASDLLGRTIAELVPPIMSVETAGTAAALVWRSLQPGEARSGVELELLGSSGLTIPVVYSAAAVEDEQGHVVGQLVVATDVGQRRSAELELRQTTERLELALAAAGLGTWDWNIVTGAFTVDSRWAAMLGYEPGELEPDISSWEALLHPHDKPRVMEALNAYLHGRAADYQLEHRMRSKHGGWRWVRTGGRVCARDSDGHPTRMTGVHGDAHEAIEAALALRESEALLSRAQRLAQVGSWEWNLQTGTVRYSEELGRIMGLGQERITSFDSVVNAVHAADREQFRKSVQQVLSGAVPAYDLEHRVVREDGSERQVHQIGEMVRDSENRPVRIVGTVQDITERKRAEAEVRRLNQELEARVAERTALLAAANRELEAFAYSVSHDLRAPLRGIDGFCQALEEDCAPQLDERGRGYLQRVRGAAGRMAGLIEDLLRLSRITRTELELEVVDLSELAAQIISELNEARGERSVETTIQDGLEAECDPRLLRAALQNLLSNAYKFTLHQPCARVEFGATEQEGTRTYFVRDNGAGFDMQYASMLFRPFQRLHASSEYEGSGVGLATVQRIIHRHGGRVWAEAEVGKGASFFFTLPARR